LRRRGGPQYKWTIGKGGRKGGGATSKDSWGRGRHDTHGRVAAQNEDPGLWGGGLGDRMQNLVSGAPLGPSRGGGPRDQPMSPEGGDQVVGVGRDKKGQGARGLGAARGGQGGARADRRGGTLGGGGAGSRARGGTFNEPTRKARAKIRCPPAGGYKTQNPRSAPPGPGLWGGRPKEWTATETNRAPPKSGGVARRGRGGLFRSRGPGGGLRPGTNKTGGPAAPTKPKG